MPHNPEIDWGEPFDWGKTSSDYSAWRPNYPDRFFELLRAFDIGIAGQHILDLGTGVGFLAVRFTQQGATSIGIDISPAQIAEARRRAESVSMPAVFHVLPAEDTKLPASSFDVVTASQSWLYLTKTKPLRKSREYSSQRDSLLPAAFVGYQDWILSRRRRRNWFCLGSDGFRSSCHVRF
jgi:SAM-dependent methyltransferase